MSLAIYVALFTFMASGFGGNIETRIHELIVPIRMAGIGFGTSIATITAKHRLVVGAPKGSYSLYYCEFHYPENITRTFHCYSFINDKNNTGFGTSLSALPSRKEVVACSNQYTLYCPNRNIKQRMIGECMVINAENSYKLSTPCPTACNTSGLSADIVFLVDASVSVGAVNFNTSLEWVRKVLQEFRYDIDQHKLWIGYAIFSNTVYRKDYPRPRSFLQVKESIEAITEYRAGGTATSLAIDAGVDLLLINSTRKVSKVMVIVTGGTPSDMNAAEESARTAREKGITIIAVGVGSKIDNANLGRTANGDTSNSERVITVANYGNLGQILHELSRLITESFEVNMDGAYGETTTELTNCQLGTSLSTATKDGVFVGAPGAYDRVGTVIEFEDGQFPHVQSSGHLTDIDMAQIIGENTRVLKDAYFGYSTSVGNFEIGNTVWIVTGAPRYMSRGAILAYKSSDSKSSLLLHPNENSSYWQIGGYYGHTVLVMDINGDGYDDLLVAEPLYAKAMGYDEGLVFVYMNNKSGNSTENWVNNGHDSILHGSDISGSRFGMSIVDAGDLDRNGYNDVIIGAPFEKDIENDESSGAIYIYYLSENGLDSQRVQKILGKSLQSEKILKSFGWAVHGQMDMDLDNYDDVAVSAPMSDSVILLRARRLIVVNSTLSVSHTGVVDVEACAAQKNACLTTTACLTAQFEYNDCYFRRPCQSIFQMVFNLTADTLVQYSKYSRFIFRHTKTNWITTKDQSVGKQSVCKSFGIMLNLHTLGKLNTGGIELTPRIEFTPDMALSHKTTILSGVLDILRPKSVDLSFKLDCLNVTCVHDLRMVAENPLNTSTKPLKLNGSRRMMKVNGTIFNFGPDKAYFLKINISSGNLTINRLISPCLEISMDESDSDRGVTVLKYSGNSNVLRDTMPAGSVCQFAITFDFTRLQLLARDAYAMIAGDIYSNVGTSMNVNKSDGKNQFFYRHPVQYETNVNLRAVSEPDTVFFKPPNNVSARSIKTLEDSVLGGKASNFFHRYTIYNKGPLGLAHSTVKIQWPEKTNEGYDLIYLMDIFCEDERGPVPTRCNCSDKNIVNKYGIVLQEHQRIKDGNEYIIVYPGPSEKITESDNLTCENSQCSSIYCDIDFVGKFQQITIVAAFKPWTPTFDKVFLKTVMESLMTIFPSASTAMPTLETVSVVSSLTAYDPDNPPPQPLTNPLNILAIVGGAIGGLILLLLLIVIMWKCGFFKSKYVDMTRQGKEALKKAQEQKCLEVEPQPSASTTA